MLRGLPLNISIKDMVPFEPCHLFCLQQKRDYHSPDTLVHKNIILIISIYYIALPFILALKGHSLHLTPRV